MNNTILSSLEEARNLLSELISNTKTHDQIAAAAEIIIKSFKNGGKVLSCGNGGSMCDAIHFAEELSGRFRDDRAALPALSISDVGHITCVGNDYGYDYIFSRYLEAHGKTQDVLFAISTSGKSKNIVEAIKTAKLIGMQVIMLTGPWTSEIVSDCDAVIAVPAYKKYADRIQEQHIKIVHIIIQLIENNLFLNKHV